MTLVVTYLTGQLFNLLFRPNLRAYLLVIVLCASQRFAYTQVISLDWQTCLGGSSYDYGRSMCLGFDNDYFVASRISSIDGDVTEAFGVYDMWITQLNMDGSLVWQKTFGGSGGEYPEDIITTVDSCIVFCGHTSSSDGLIDTNYGLSDIVVIKMDTLGNIIWQSILPGSRGESAHSIIQTSDGGYILTGFSYSDDGFFGDHIGVTEYSDIVVVKLDAFGVVEWLKSYGSDRDDIGQQIIETSDGNFIIVGSKWGGFAVESQYYIVKISLTGEVIWEKLYGGSEGDYAHAVLEISPGRYLVSGESYSSDGDVYGAHGSRDVWTLLLDSSGEPVWSRAYGGSGAEVGSGLLIASDNTFVISGATATDNNGDVFGFHGGGMVSDVWLLAIDSLNIIQWQKCLGGTSSDHGTEAISDGSEITIAGYTSSNDGDVSGIHGGPPYMYDAWVVKLSLNCTPVQYYADTDFDGYGNPDVYVYSCTDTLGYVLDNTDCIDTSALIHPELPEQCNGIDDNCDGVVDEGFVYVLQYADADGDSYGNQEADSLGCPGLAGYVSDSLDCNDNNPDIYPEAIELLNGIDDDCDGLNDEGLVVDVYGADVLQVYPVPAADYIRIETEMPNGGTLQVFNPSGEQVFEIKNWSGEILAIDSLPAALYCVRILYPEGIMQCYFIKQ